MYVLCMYLLKLIQFYCRWTSIDILHSHVIVAVQIFFISLPILLLFTQEQTVFAISHFCFIACVCVCMCVCGCVCAIKLLSFSMTMKVVLAHLKYSVDMQVILGTAVCCEGCKTEHKLAVSHSVFAEGSLRSRSTDQDIHRFL